MKKFSFIDFVWEIWTVGKERNVDVDVAYDMFRTDVAHGEAQPCNTGDSLPDFDYEAAKSAWDALTDVAQNDAHNEWLKFSREHYSEICSAFAEGKEAVDNLASKNCG